MEALKRSHPLKRLAQWILRHELEVANKHYLRIMRERDTVRAELNDTYKELLHERRRLR